MEEQDLIQWAEDHGAYQDEDGNWQA